MLRDRFTVQSVSRNVGIIRVHWSAMDINGQPADVYINVACPPGLTSIIRRGQVWSLQGTPDPDR